MDFWERELEMVRVPHRDFRLERLTGCRCFIAPCPITLSGLIFILWKLPNPDVEKAEEVTTKTQIARVDFYGAAALVGFVLSFLLLLDRATKQAPNGLIAGLAASTAVCLAVFIFVESKVAQEPILPIGLLANRDVFIPYLIVGCKSAGQFTVWCFADDMPPLC